MPEVLYLSQRFSPDSISLGNSASAQGWEVSRVSHRDLASVKAKIASKERVAIYAEWLLLEYFKQEGILLIEPADSALLQIPAQFVKREVRQAKLSQCPNGQFVKPLNGKEFNGHVSNDVARLLGDYGDIDVLYSEVVEFESEIRCFVLNKQVISSSHYTGKVPQPEELVTMRQLADQLAGIPSERTYVVDIGITSQAEAMVVEFNPVSSSGIYGCDPLAVLACLESAVQGLR